MIKYILPLTILISTAVMAAPFDFDSYIGEQGLNEIQAGKRCKLDLAMSPMLDAAFEKFKSEWLDDLNGQYKLKSFLFFYFQRKTTGTKKFYSPYTQNLPEALQGYFIKSVDYLIEQLLYPKRQNTILIGDSLMEMYKVYSDKNSPTWNERAFNAGIGGDTLGLLQTRAKWNILAHKPKKVILSISGNNILSGCLIDQHNQMGRNVFERLKAFILKLKSAGVKQIHLFNMPAVGFIYPRTTILNYNQLMQKLEEIPGVFVFDQYSHLATDRHDKKIWTYYSPLDPIHLSDLVYQFIWTPYLNKVIL